MNGEPTLTAVAATAARAALTSAPGSAEAIDDLDRRARVAGLVWDRYARAYHQAPIAPTPTRARNTGTLRADEQRFADDHRARFAQRHELAGYRDGHAKWAVRRVEEGMGP